MKLITFDMNDGRQIQINPEQVVYVIQRGENTELGGGGMIVTVAEPVGAVLNRMQEKAAQNIGEPDYTTDGGIRLTFGEEWVATGPLDADDRDLRIEDLMAQIATAKREACEQIARLWEKCGCKMEANEVRSMARQLGYE